MENQAYKILKEMCKETDPDRILAGRREAFTTDNLPKILSSAHERLLLLKGDEVAVQNTISVLDWLIAGRGRKTPFSPATVHIYLEYILLFVKTLPDQSWLSVLGEIKKDTLLLLVGKNKKNSVDFLSVLRSYYAFHKKIEKTNEYPTAIRKEYELKVNRPKKLLSPMEVERLVELIYKDILLEHSEVDHDLLVDLLCVFIYLSVVMALRDIEVLELREIEVGFQETITVTVYAKGQKTVIKESPEEIEIPAILIEALNRLRNKGFDGKPTRSFFQAFERLFGENREGSLTHGEIYRMLLSLLKKLGHEEGTHSFRRLWVNMARAVGMTPLEIIHFLGHAVAKNVFENYLQILPKLQEERLKQWIEEKKKIRPPTSLTIQRLAELQGISTIGVKKQAKRVHLAVQGRSMTMELANNLLRKIILEVQPIDIVIVEDV